MRPLRGSAIVLFCICLPAFAQAQNASHTQTLEDPLEVLKREPARVKPYYSNDASQGDFLSRGQQKRSEMSKADIRAREAVVQLLRQEHGNVDQLPSRTLGVVTWRQWPKNPTDEQKTTFDVGEGRLDEKLRVNYRKWTGKDGTEITFLQNSFWNRTGYRISPAVYALIRSGSRLTTSMLAPYSSGGGGEVIDWFGTTPAMFLVGFAPGEGSMPNLLTMVGPSGRVENSEFFLYTYDEQEGVWKPQLLISQDDIQFSYDEGKAELLFSAPFEVPNKPLWERKYYLYRVGSPDFVEVDKDGNPVSKPLPLPFAK